MELRGLVLQCGETTTEALTELKQRLFTHGFSFACVVADADARTSESAAEFAAGCAQLSRQDFVFVPRFLVRYRDWQLLCIGTTVFHDQPIKTSFELQVHRQTTPFLVLGNLPQKVVPPTLIPLLDAVVVWDAAGSPNHAALQVLRELRIQKEAIFALSVVTKPHPEMFAQAPAIVLSVTHSSVFEIIDQLRQGFYTLQTNEITLAASGRPEGLRPWWQKFFGF